MAAYPDKASAASYDVVIIGGAIMGSSTAWWLTQLADFDGSVLVVERDPSYAACSTAHTNSCIRQQFSSELNIRISQFTAEFLRTLGDRAGGNAQAPDIRIQNFGYLYLADTETKANALRAAQEVQLAAGAGTRLLTRAEIAEEFPFYYLDDIVLGSHNTKDEGYWDGGALFEWFRRNARARGAEYIHGDVVAIDRDRSGRLVSSVTLDDGQEIACGHVVNAAGPRAAHVAALAGLEIPVEPRKRFSWVFKAETPLDRDLPLTINPSGIHVRQDGPATYLAGATPSPDPAVAPDDFDMDHEIWENAIVGPHPALENFLFLNGFSGHGLQQAPPMGLATAEWLTHGEFRTLDLSPFQYDRIARGTPYAERAVI